MTNEDQEADEVAQPPSARGSCLCGAVTYDVHGPLRQIIYCHCSMCRRTSGHFVAASACARENLKIHSHKALRWYQSSPAARRGFCQVCGSNLFWDAIGATTISLMAGSLNVPTGLSARAHIFTADAGDYYDILDGLQQHLGWPEDSDALHAPIHADTYPPGGRSL